MLQERGEVVSIETGAVWVQTRRQSACSGCSARAGCGHALMDKLQNNRSSAYIRARNELDLHVGDQVEIGIPEQAVMRGSVQVYLWPLLAFMAGIWLGFWAGWSEPVIVLSGFLALGGAFFVVYRQGRAAGAAALEPVILSIYRCPPRPQVIAEPLDQ